MMADAKRDDPDRRLSLAVDDIQRQYGAGSIIKGDAKPADVPAISTGALTLDLALGVGGIPRGRIIEIFGSEGSGKTTLALQIVASAQRLGGKAVYIDAEHAIDMQYAARIGVDRDELLFSQPGSAEEALGIAQRLIESDAVDIVVVDSVAALVPRAELAGEMGENHAGLQARLMSQAMRKMIAGISRSCTAVIFINQIRMKIGVTFGNPETTPGGRALKFGASVRLDVRRVGHINEGDREVGAVVRVKVVKNKIAPPHRKAEFDLMYDSGISWEGTVLDEAMRLGLVTRSGSWFTRGRTRLGQGRENAKRHLASHPELMFELENAARQDAGLPPRVWGTGPEILAPVGDVQDAADAAEQPVNSEASAPASGK